jgi:hypothetical protein
VARLSLHSDAAEKGSETNRYLEIVRTHVHFAAYDGRDAVRIGISGRGAVKAGLDSRRAGLLVKPATEHPK